MSVVDYERRGSIGVLRLNSPPVNAITFAVLEELRNAVRRAKADAQVRGLVITGDARHFSAGADVNLFREITGAEDAVQTSRVFQEAFQEVEDSGKPVVAAVAGHVTGGALELAMACHFRVCASDSRFSAPEVKLGINPGAGGTQRLPRLIGVGPALKMLLTGEAISADEALAAGLVDAVCEGKELIEKAGELLNSARLVIRTKDRMDKVQDSHANDAAFAEAERLLANGRLEIIAPSLILDAVKTGLGAGFGAAWTTGGGSAELHSAVSQISNLQDPLAARTPSRLQVGDTAECNSALRSAPEPCADSVGQRVPPVRGAPPHGRGSAGRPATSPEQSRDREGAVPGQAPEPTAIGTGGTHCPTDSFEAGLRKEQEGFAACMETLATRNKIYLFFATRETARTPGPHSGVVDAGAERRLAAGFAQPQNESPSKPLHALSRLQAGAPPSAHETALEPALAEAPPSQATTNASTRQAAVVGMGSMGTGIAHALIIAGVPVVALDQSEAIVQKGLNQIRNSIENRVAQRKCSRERAGQMLALIRTTTNWRDLADADLVIEAVFEDVPAKRAVIASIEQTCRADTIIASNTSTISLDDLADGMKHPERLVGIHFFNPAHIMPLVEVIHRTATPPAITTTAMRFAKVIRKTPVLVRNREGFVVNRMFIPYVKEAFWLLEEGADARAIDRAMVEFGFPMGPFVLIDMAGLDILAMTDRVMSRVFPKHGPLPAVAAKLVEGGHLGQKSGSGVYRYEKGDRHPHDSEATGQILRNVRAAKGGTPRAVSGDEITERLVLRMVHEAFCLMEEGVAQRQSDVDAATVLGLGFPDFRGGVLKYAHDLGLENVKARIAKLAERWGERFSAGELRSN